MAKPKGMRTQQDTVRHTHSIPLEDRLRAVCALVLAAFVGHGVASVTGIGYHIWFIAISVIVTSIVLRDYFL
jgi:hypothetical protein